MATSEKIYTCVLVNDEWCATQEQANPPVLSRMPNAGAWTICCQWATFTRGFDKRRPTCKTCLDACVRYEKKYGERDAAWERERQQQTNKKSKKIKIEETED